MPYDFDKIACTYDRMNCVMTLGLDRCWRRRAAHEVESGKWNCGRRPCGAKVESVLDVACGTGDMCVELLKRGCKVTGVDLSEEMLDIAKVKGERLKVKVEFADAENLPFENESFDAVTCAFGVRNFVHLERGLSEMLRVLKPGGCMVILELATPDSKLIRPFYNFYTKHIIPLLGKWLAGNREAYIYLPTSIERFPKGEDFLQIIQNSEFKIQNSCQHKLTCGVCRLYVINKGAAK